MSGFKVTRANALYEIFTEMSKVLSDKLCPLKEECNATGWDYKHTSHARTWSFRCPKEEVSRCSQTIMIETLSTDGLGLNCVQVHRMYYSTNDKSNRDRIVWCFVISDRCTVSELKTDTEAIGNDPNPFFKEHLTEIFGEMDGRVKSLTHKLSEKFCFAPNHFTVGAAYRIKAIGPWTTCGDDPKDDQLLCGVTAIFAGFSSEFTIARFKTIRQDETGSNATFDSEWEFTREFIQDHDIHIVELTVAGTSFHGWCIGWKNKINIPDIQNILSDAWRNMLGQDWLKFIAPDCWNDLDLPFIKLEESNVWGSSESVYHIDSQIHSDGAEGSLRLRVNPKYGDDKTVDLLRVDITRTDIYPRFESKLVVTFPHIKPDCDDHIDEDEFFKFIKTAYGADRVTIVASDCIMPYINDEETVRERIGESKLEMIKRYILEPISRLYVMKGFAP